MKRQISLYLDMELIIELQKRGTNISNVVGNFLRSYLEMPKSEIKEADIDKEILQNEATLVELKSKKEDIEKEEKKKYPVVIDG